MQVALGRVPAQLERPPQAKFAWPIIVLPELFSTAWHLSVVIGYLASIGWEVYAPDLRAAAAQFSAGGLAGLSLREILGLLDELLAALGTDAVLLGHGLGGLLALKMAERAGVRATVAFAPLIPGVRTPLFMRAGNLLSWWRGRPIQPPRGRVLFELVAELEPFQRENAIKAFVADAAVAAIEVVRGNPTIALATHAAPRLIVCGDSDNFAPLDQARLLASTSGAQLVTLAGRGHWLIGGRALEAAISETQRFLVRALGQDLLLLLPEELKGGSESE